MEPSDVTALTAEVNRLSALVARLVAIPGEHRDDLLNNPPMSWSSKSMDVARDTCDVLGHKLRAVAADVPSRPCQTCGSHSRLVRRIPVPKESDYRNGAFNDPDYDPKFSTPCTDPWHEET